MIINNDISSGLHIVHPNHEYISGSQEFQAVKLWSVYRVADPDPFQSRPRSMIINNELLSRKKIRTP